MVFGGIDRSPRWKIGEHAADQRDRLASEACDGFGGSSVTAEQKAIVSWPSLASWDLTENVVNIFHIRAFRSYHGRQPVVVGHHLRNHAPVLHLRFSSTSRGFAIVLFYPLLRILGRVSAGMDPLLAGVVGWRSVVGQSRPVVLHLAPAFLRRGT